MEVLERFKREMSKNFKMSDLAVLSYYLDIEVQQSTAGITICQGAYAKKLLDIVGLAQEPQLRPDSNRGRPALRRQSTPPITAALSGVCAIW